MNEILNKFGKSIKKERAKLNLSQEQLAEKAGLHRTYVGMIERGEKNISLKNVNKLATALEVPVKDLFNEQ